MAGSQFTPKPVYSIQEVIAVIVFFSDLASSIGLTQIAQEISEYGDSFYEAGLSLESEADSLSEFSDPSEDDDSHSHPDLHQFGYLDVNALFLDL